MPSRVWKLETLDAVGRGCRAANRRTLPSRPKRPIPVSQVLLTSTDPTGDHFFAKIAVVRLEVVTEVEALVVERQAQVHVDGAGKAAFDPVGRGVLVDLDRAEQLGRHVLEIDAPDRRRRSRKCRGR